MTIEIYPDLDDEGWRSTRYEVAINGTPAFVIGTLYEDAPFATQFFGAGDDLYESYLCVGADEPFDATISYAAGGPSEPLMTQALVVRKVEGEHGTASVVAVFGGSITLTLATGERVWIYTDGNMRDPLRITSNPPEEAIPPGAVVYADGEPASIEEGEVVVFPAGKVHNIGYLYRVEKNGTALIKGLVRGNFDVSELVDPVENKPFRGNGFISGDQWDPDTVLALPFSEALTYSTFFGRNGAQYAVTGCEVVGVSVIRPAFWLDQTATNVLRHVHFYNPQRWGIGGHNSDRDFVTGAPAVIEGGSAVGGDDTIMLSDKPTQSMVVSDLLVGHGWGSAICLQMFGWEREPGTSRTVRDVSVFTWASVGDNDPFNSVVRSTVDTAIGDEDHGDFDFDVEVHVLGTILCRPFAFANVQFAFMSALWKDRRGQIAFGRLKMTTVQAPSASNPALIDGFDAVSTPHDIELELDFGGVQVTVANAEQFIERNAFPYNIWLPTGGLIGADNLPRPHAVTVLDQSVVPISRITTMPWGLPTDRQLRPRQFLATWRPTRLEVGEAVLRHHEQHPFAVVQLFLPQTGETVRVQWSSPPQLQVGTSVSAASITAVFDEVLAF